MVRDGDIDVIGSGKGGDMAKKFKEPNFGNRHIELRFDEEEVCIYATKTGLEKLIYFCKSLLDNPQKAHIHLEDYEVLTKESLRGTIAIFGE
jgi:hypothetical protein